MWKVRVFDEQEEDNKLYILNALITPFGDENAQFKISRISLDKAKELYSRFPKEKIVSAIGHQSTAQLISTLLDTEVPMNRINVYFKPGDTGLVFALKQRAPEGKVLTKDEILKMGLDIFYVLRVE